MPQICTKTQLLTGVQKFYVCIVCYILQPLLLVVNVQVVYTVNMVAYRKHLFTTSCVYGTQN